ncbi:MAG: glycosyltransferase [Oscillospiraceae bacterium]|nr:glycosyltransferase [Oscillospiraceae bacterium]
MKKILFMIPTLMHGGAEKVLVNLVNNLSREKYDITLMTLFDEGVNKQYLKKDIKYKYVFKHIFKGNTKILKLFSPQALYKRFIKDKYDIAVSYLEGPTARIISGCPNKSTKLVSWIHIEQENEKIFAYSFRTVSEARKCYNRFDRIVCVSDTVKKDFEKLLPFEMKHPIDVIYNINETDAICVKAKEQVEDIVFDKNTVNIVSVAKIMKTKGYDRLAAAHKRLIGEGYIHHIYILGIGEEKENIQKYIDENGLGSSFTFLGFRDNPYKYVLKCDLYVCSSRREGFSTAVTEALILGIPVVSTRCSGAEELLGKNNEFGIIVDNSEEGIYLGMKKLLSDKNALAEYKKAARKRGASFVKSEVLKANEDFFDSI